METITSPDGTTIAFDRAGSGQPVILVEGALSHRSAGLTAPIAQLLADRFTTVIYDRRGRADSGAGTPYAVDREVEDLVALIDAVGGTAALVAFSSGAALALETARQHPDKVTRLALYEPPFVVDDSREPMPIDLADRLETLAATGNAGAANRLFLTKGVGLPLPIVWIIGLTPDWKRMKSIAHTLSWDVRTLGGLNQGRPLPQDRWAALTMPALLINGDKTERWMKNSARAVAEVLPNAEHRTLPGQTHMVKAEPIAPMLREFLSQ